MNYFMQPPLPVTASNELRKVGFELEYGAIPLQKSAELLLSVVEYGTIEKTNPYHYEIKNTPYGNFNLVLDFQFLISQGLQKWLQDTGLDQIIETEIALDLEEFIATISETVVPYEITTPPLSLDNLELIENIKETFRIHGALGTDANPFYAFGFHINPQVTSFEVTEIVDILRAFFILYENLLVWLQPDITRKITPYIKPFEDEYIQKVLDTSYMPDINRFIKEYLIYNPTRNRALDLLPLLAWIDSKQVFTALPTEKISPRPTYHYRLPNSKVDKKEWHTYDAWNSWVMIEKLAQDKDTLNKLGHEYMSYLEDPFAFFKKDEWIQKVEQWLEKQM